MSWIDRARLIREHEGVSYSALKRLNVSPKIYKTHIELEETDSMLLGSAFETYLCFGEEEFNKYYIVLKAAQPTGLMLKFCKELINLGEITNENFQIAYERTDAKRDSLDQFINNWEKSEARDFTLESIEAKGKTPITIEVYEKILQQVLKVKTNPFFNQIFENSSYQVPLIKHDKTRDLSLKGLADVVYEKDGITYIIDIKTTSLGVSGFMNSVLKYRYDLQASWYTHLMDKPCVFQFLVIDMKYDDEPVIFEPTEEFLNKARYGFTLNSGRVFKGWEQLLDELVEHKKLDMWDYPLEIYKNKGIVKLDI